MESEFRAQLTELGYIHEVLADFGPQDTGVFNKDCIDIAANTENYAYNELTQAQLTRIKNTNGELPVMYLPLNDKFKPNIFRTIGVDWDEYLSLCREIYRQITSLIQGKYKPILS